MDKVNGPSCYGFRAFELDGIVDEASGSVPVDDILDAAAAAWSAHRLCHPGGAAPPAIRGSHRSASDMALGLRYRAVAAHRSKLHPAG